jgi:hypothetical protein
VGTGHGVIVVVAERRTGATVTGWSTLGSPNQVTLSWTMRHWK